MSTRMLLPALLAVVSAALIPPAAEAQRRDDRIQQRRGDRIDQRRDGRIDPQRDDRVGRRTARVERRTDDRLDGRQIRGARPEHVQGEVVATRTVRLLNSDQQHLLALLRTDAGWRITADLGAVEQVENMRPEVGETIEVIGRTIQVRNRPVIVAQQFRLADRSVVIDRPTEDDTQLTDGQIPEELKNHHRAENAAINSNNVGQLKLKWKIETDGNVSHTPLFQNGRIYFADWTGTVHCVRADNGEHIWRKDVEQPKTEWPWHGFCGTGCLGEGMLFQASAEGNAFALDAETGEVIWQTRFEEDPQGGNCGRLMYYNGMVFIPVASVEEALDAMKEDFEPNFRGKVVALDAKTGDRIWQRHLVRPPHNGAGVWSGFAVDPELNLLYFTTSNNYTGEGTQLSDSIVAVDINTGRIQWAVQATSNDIWTMANRIGPDYAFAAAPQLFEADLGGQRMKLLAAAQKSGVLWALCRETGQVVWTTTIGYGHIGGGLHSEVSIGDGVIYAWANNAYPYKNPEQHPMDIKAIDAATGKYLWSNPKAQPALLVSSGVLANDVYFVGSLDGKVRGYHADNGERVWTSQETGPIASSLVVADDLLCFGVGVPKHFGGGGETRGLFAFALSAESGNASQDQASKSEGSQQNQSQQTQKSQETREVKIVAVDFDFNPSQFTVSPGQKLQVTLVNEGNAPHNIEFELPSGEKVFDQNLAPGESRTMTFTAPEKPGEYVYYCPVANHRAHGMEGTLVVKKQ